ncbi:MAG: lytic transglycosylase domain-containing protein [Candidatus Korobacteraceae bacterium]
MRKLLQLSLLGLLVASQMHAAELANLRNGFSIRHERHEVDGNTTRLYMSAEPSSGYVDVPTAEIESFEPAPPEAQADASPGQKPADLNAIVNAASTRSQVDADFIASVIRAESGNNPLAVSRKGAQGLMQLMPGTASKLGVRNTFDPAENVDGGVRYLRELLLLYNNDMVKALAAYNAGPQRVQQYKGVPPYRETHAYVARVINDYNRKKLAQRKHQPKTPVRGAATGRPEIAQSAAGSTANTE